MYALHPSHALSSMWPRWLPLALSPFLASRDPLAIHAPADMKRPGLYEVPSDADIAKMVKKI